MVIIQHPNKHAVLIYAIYTLYTLVYISTLFYLIFLSGKAADEGSFLYKGKCPARFIYGRKKSRRF